MRDVISVCVCFVCVLLRLDKELCYRLCFKNLFLRLSLCLCVVVQSFVNTQHSIRLFGCAVLV